MSRPLPALPRLKPHVAIVPVGPENVLIRVPGVFVQLSGEGVPVLDAILPYLDGTNTTDRVAERSGVPASDVRDVLEFLAADGLLEDAAQDGVLRLDADERARLAPQLAYFSHLTGNAANAQNRVTEARVLVVGLGALGATAAETLVSAGVGEVGLADASPVRPEDATILAYAGKAAGGTRAETLASALSARPGARRVRPVPLSAPDLRRVGAAEFGRVVKGWTHVLLVTDEPLPTVFAAVNEAAIEAGVEWTGAHAEGLEAFVGPTVLPGQTACWRCYDLRVKGAFPNMDRLTSYEAGRDASARPGRAAALPSFAHVAGAWAAQAVLQAVSGTPRSPLVNVVSRISLPDLVAERHRVLRIPRCPACTKTNIPDVDRFTLAPVKLP